MNEQEIEVRQELARRWAEEKATVARVWKALGISTYEQAKPPSIDEHVTQLRADLKKAIDLLAEEVEGSGDDRAQDRAKCPGCAFRRGNHFLPPSHPVWAVEPDHTCWPYRVRNFLYSKP